MGLQAGRGGSSQAPRVLSALVNMSVVFLHVVTVLLYTARNSLPKVYTPRFQVS